jgi:flagellar motor protein MotB
MVLEQRDVAVIQRDVARSQVAGLVAELDGYQNQVAALMCEQSGANSVIETLTNDSAELRKQLAGINGRYSGAMDSGAGWAAMPAALRDELAAFAAAHADLVEWVADKGVVRFKSDAAFGKGSAELTPTAKAVAAKLAKILAASNGAGWELMVAGHTDATPVSNPATVKAGHKDNWHLSAHRAIALGQVLTANQVSPSRLAMVGYADQRPVAPNTTNAGRAQNRRVEVLVLASKAGTPAATPASTPVATTVAPAATPSWTSLQNDTSEADAFGDWDD